MFKNILKAKKITQQELANVVKKSQRLVSEWVNGKCQPQLSEVVKIAQFLNVSTDEIINCFIKK